MAEKTLGPEFLIHGGGLDLVFPHHENERAQSQAVGRPFAKIWMHNGLLRFTGEKMSKSVGNVATIQEVIAEWGREAALLFLMTGHWRKPLEFSPEAMTAASVQVESLRNALRGETRASGDWDELAAVLDDDFNTPAALAVFHRWAREGALDELRRGLAVFGLAGLGDAVEAPARSWRSRRRGPTARAARDFAESDRLRDEIAAAGWEVRDVRARRLRARAAAVTRELVYGRNAVREALRGRREVLELWVSERAAASLDWLGEGPRPQVVKERELTEAAASPDHQGVVAWASPYPYADPWELAAHEKPLLACLDQVTDPRNLGAVDPLRGRRRRDRRDRARPRGGAGDAGRLPVVGGDRRAPAGGGRAEPRPLPGGDQAGRPLVVRRDGGRAADDVAGRPHRRRRARLRRRGQGRPAARPQDVRRRDLDSARTGGRVAERQRRSGGAAVRGAPAAAAGRGQASTCPPGSEACLALR